MFEQFSVIVEIIESLPITSVEASFQFSIAEVLFQFSIKEVFLFNLSSVKVSFHFSTILYQFQSVDGGWALTSFHPLSFIHGLCKILGESESKEDDDDG